MTPLEIRKHQFKRSVSGFNRDEVTTFLELVTSDMENLLRENALLKERLQVLEDKNREFQAMQETLQGVLLTAEKRVEVGLFG